MSNDHITKTLAIRDCIISRLANGQPLNASIVGMLFGISNRQGKRYLKAINDHYGLGMQWDESRKTYTARQPALKTQAARHKYRYRGNLFSRREIAEISGREYSTVHGLVWRNKIPTGSDITALVDECRIMGKKGEKNE